MVALPSTLEGVWGRPEPTPTPLPPPTPAAQGQLRAAVRGNGGSCKENQIQAAKRFRPGG